MNIATGTAEDHPTPLPLDAAATPAVQAPTVIFPPDTSQGAVRDLTGERLSQLAAGEADIAGAKASGEAADSDRRGRYASGIAPIGATGHGDQMTLPEPPGVHSKHVGGDDGGYAA